MVCRTHDYRSVDPRHARRPASTPFASAAACKIVPRIVDMRVLRDKLTQRDGALLFGKPGRLNLAAGRRRMSATGQSKHCDSCSIDPSAQGVARVNGVNGARELPDARRAQGLK
jgi:hypothetical protein